VLLLGLDFSRCVEGGVVTNSPLDFRQYSFTHIIQVSGLRTLVNGFPVHPFSDMLLSRVRFSPFG
jgi:hypothetical protein